ncbi:MAG: M56 family metallopeptidase [Faecousia sp.]
MNTLFQNILTASFHGSIVIAAVILLRLVLKKTPRKYICMLWLLAGLRLLMPFQIQSELSLQPRVDTVTEVRQQIAPPQDPTAPAVDLSAAPKEPSQSQAPVTLQPELTQSITVISGTTSHTAAPETEPEAPFDFLSLLPWFWFGIACCFGIYSLYTYLSLKLKVREAIKIPGGWECDRIETAFILGFVRPKIYIPMGLSPATRRHILAHERTHLDKGDHWFKMIGFLALALHWFNPLVWAAYILLCKDIEIACDERVVQFMELEERKEYSAALLSCSTNRAHFAACPVAFGEVSVKERIKSVLSYKKPGFWISLVGVIAIVFVAVCLVTSPAREADTPASGDTEPTVGSDAVTVHNVDELLAAIAPDTEIQLAAGSYNLSGASDYGLTPESDYYAWIEAYDGYELQLQNVENLTIRGGGKLVTTLETDPRSASVLHLHNCSNVTLEDFTAGHTIELGECSSGVIYLTECSAIDMNRLGIYGCGMVGLQTAQSSDISLSDSDVYECSSTAAEIFDSENVSISGSRIYNIGSAEYGGYTYFEIASSQNVTVENCEISDSTLMNLANLSGDSCSVQIKNNLFTSNRIQQEAFGIYGSELILDGNKFEGNSIRRWFTDGAAADAAGNPITEEQMNGLYSEEPTETRQAQLEIHVSTVDELIAAIGPNTEIVLDAALYDLSTATGYGTSQGDYYYWEDIFDGPALIITNVDNLTIRSNDGNVTGHTIAAIPRYADVLTFKACSNVTLSGFTAGHTREPGSCAGGVLEFRDSDSITVDSCGLYGCGILGVYAEYSSNIQVVNCDIYECSQGGVQFRETRGILMENNTLRDLGGDNMSFIGCEDVTVDGEILIPKGLISSMSLQSPEQADVQRLNNLVTEFAYAYFQGDTQILVNDLSAGYTGTAQTYPGEKSEVIVCWHEVTLDMWKEATANGYYQFAYPYRKTPESEITYLSIDVVKENDAWKVSAYALDS